MVSIKVYFKRLQIIFGFLLGGLIVLFIASMCFLDPSRYLELDLFFIITNSILLITCLVVAYLFSNKKINSAKIKRGLGEKLAEYKKALFIKWSVFEFLGLYSILAYQVTDDEIFVCVTIFTMALMYMNRSTIGMTCDNLELDEQEIRIIKNPKSVI